MSSTSQRYGTEAFTYIVSYMRRSMQLRALFVPGARRAASLP